MIRFILDNDAIDNATLSSSPTADTSYPVDNLKLISRSKPMRSVDAESQFDIKGTLTEDQIISSLVLARHNFSSTITYTLNLYSDASWTTPIANYTPEDILVTADQASISGLYEWGEFAWGTITWGSDKPDLDNRNFYDIVLWLDQPHTIRSFMIRLNVYGGAIVNPFYCDESTILCDGSVVGNPSITITCDMLGFGGGTGDPGATSGIPYYEVGKVFLGPYIEPLYNLSPGHTISWEENTTQYRPSSGTLKADLVTSNKAFEFSLVTIPESDRVALHKQLVNKGLSEDFYISMFPNNASNAKEVDYSGIVKLTKMPKYTNYINSYYKSNFVMEEV